MQALNVPSMELQGHFSVYNRRWCVWVPLTFVIELDVPPWLVSGSNRAASEEKLRRGVAGRGSFLPCQGIKYNLENTRNV